MSSWGASTSDESKPKYLTDVEKRDCFANNTGWTVPAGGNDNPAALRETLVTIGELSGGATGTAKLAAATISSIRLITTALGAADGGSFSAEVVYNEAVDITAAGLGDTVRITVTNTPGNDLVLDYTDGTVTGTNRLTFTSLVAANSLSEDDVLSIASGNVVLAGTATIQDAGTSTDSGLAHGAAAGSVTVGA
jgi:hypothetical protein